MFLLLAADVALQDARRGVPIMRAVPPLAGAVVGAALFPLAQTIVGSADGTPPFFGRLRAAYARDRGYVRGARGRRRRRAGAQLATSATTMGCSASSRCFSSARSPMRASTSVADLLRLLRGRRKTMQNWHVYALGTLLGGLVGGALGWYFDAAQIDVVVSKFFAYTDLDYAGVGRAINPFGTYPLFNKYGAIDLGPVAGGVRLFFDESLTGVVNWAIAAPLFSINFFVLTAIIDRSLSPLKRLFSVAGFPGARRAGRPRARLGPLDGAGHQFVPAPVARAVLVQSGWRHPDRDGDGRRLFPADRTSFRSGASPSSRACWPTTGCAC